MTEENKTISKTFSYHKPSDEGLAKIKQIREAYTSLQSLITSLAPQSREKSVALTELETSGMWAIKAVVLNDPNSVIE